MSTPVELSDWIWKVVRGLRDEDEMVYRARFKEQWRQHYESFLATGKNEKEAGSLALAQMGDAREVRTQIREKVLTQSEWRLLECVEGSLKPDEPLGFSRKDSTIFLLVCLLLSVPVWIFVPLNVLGKVAFICVVFGGVLSVLLAVTYCEKVFERWIRKRYSMSRLLVWRACTMPLWVPLWMFICLVSNYLTDFLLGPDECDVAPSCDSARFWFAVIMVIGLGGGFLVYQIYKHLALAKKLSRMEGNPLELNGQTYPAV